MTGKKSDKTKSGKTSKKKTPVHTDKNNKKFFNKVANNKLGTNANGWAKNKCPDQTVGIVKVEKEATLPPALHPDKRDFCTRESVECYKQYNKIIMILESPHVDEFICEQPSPAKGTTGRNILTYFGEACKLHEEGIKFGQYPLILMNAIQYQCSLGYPTEKYRDKTFKTCWKEFGKTDFRIRFKAIYREGDIVINACTLGTEKSNPDRVPEKYEGTLKKMVADVISKKVNDHHFVVNHPSYWHNGNFNWGIWEI